MVISGFSILDVHRIGDSVTKVDLGFPYDFHGDVYGRFVHEKLWRTRKEWYLFDGEEIQGLNRIVKPHETLKKVIFSPPATVVFWEDGTKTVVKSENEPFDAEKGFAMAVAKKFLTSKDYHRIMASAKDYRESVCIDNAGQTRRKDK